METNIVEAREKITDVINRYQDRIGREASDLAQEMQVDSAEGILSQLEELRNTNRVLRIGVVGRVKAGKSSLLNALLFEGQSILPKAATPMTAALTQISYGERLEAEIEFYSASDIEAIKSEALHCEEEIRLRAEELKERRIHKTQGTKGHERKVAQNNNPREKKPDFLETAKREIKKEASFRWACLEQYELMQNAGISEAQLDDTTIPANTLDVLKQKLGDYVSKNGQFMPFTKSVHLRLPLDKLKELEIVDTPGVNDPVRSREKRTQELLKSCDVVFVVSPASRFITDDDLSLMDRIGTKEGIRELYAVVSQIDTTLFSSERDDFGGKLPDVLHGVRKKLSDHLQQTLMDLKERNPETEGIYSQLMENGRVLHTSGLCYSILKKRQNNLPLDEGEESIFNYLLEEYPDYFTSEEPTSTNENLKLIANLEGLNRAIQQVRDKKEQILKERERAFLEDVAKKIASYQKALFKLIEEKLDRLKATDLGELLERINRLAEANQKVETALDDWFDEFVFGLIDKIRENSKKSIKETFDQFYGAVDSHMQTTTETRNKRGLASWIARKLWDGGHKTVTVDRVYVGAVRNEVEGFKRGVFQELDKVNDRLDAKIKASFKKELIRTWRKALGEENDDLVDSKLAQSVARSILNELSFEIDLPDLPLPESLEGSGAVTGDQAQDIVFEAQQFIGDLNNKMIRKINASTKKLSNLLLKTGVPQKVIQRYEKELEALQNEVEGKKLVEKEYHRLIKELKKVR